MPRDDGLLKICSLVNTADAGNKPLLQLSTLDEQWYEEREIGYRRQYLAKGADEQIDMIVRIWRENYRPKIGHYVVIGTDQYRITNMQPTTDEDELPVYDLTLTALEKHYDVIAETEEDPGSSD